MNPHKLLGRGQKCAPGAGFISFVECCAQDLMGLTGLNRVWRLECLELSEWPLLQQAVTTIIRHSCSQQHQPNLPSHRQGSEFSPASPTNFLGSGPLILDFASRTLQACVATAAE